MAVKIIEDRNDARRVQTLEERIHENLCFIIDASSKVSLLDLKVRDLKLDVSELSSEVLKYQLDNLILQKSQRYTLFAVLVVSLCNLLLLTYILLGI